MTRLNYSCLSIPIGIVYLWFGALKFFPGLSPAEGLASETIDLLSLHLLSSDYSLFLLAFWECTIGFLLLFKNAFRWALPMAIIHIILTFTPILLLPEKVYNNSPLLLTITGQYIVKNIVILSVLLVIWKEYRSQRRAKLSVPVS
jgi:uncharacterized membrane protein YkgB